MWKSLRRQGCNSRLIRVSAGEEMILIFKSILVVLLLDYCFYQSFAALFPLFIPGYYFYRKEKKALFHKKREEIRQQFKEMLLLAVTGQKAGYSVENAFLKSYEDMEALYGSDSSICRILREIKAGLSNNRKLSELWKRIGEECAVEEIREFASVFDIAKESSGEMGAVMERTVRIIVNRAETQKEIEVLLSAKKLEQKIMNVMPFALMVYISATSPGYFEGFYHNLPGIFIMTICLLLYLGAYLMGEKIAETEV